MDEARRFLRYLMPGMVFVLELALVFGIWRPEWFQRWLTTEGPQLTVKSGDDESIRGGKPVQSLVDKFADSPVAFAVTALFASGAVGYLLSLMHHTTTWTFYRAFRILFGWQLIQDHRECINQLEARHYIAVERIGDAEGVSPDTTVIGAWRIATALWESRAKRLGLPAESAYARVSSLCDLTHGAGAALMGVLVVALLWGLVGVFCVWSIGASTQADMQAWYVTIVLLLLLLLHFIAFRTVLAHQVSVAEIVLWETIAIRPSPTASLPSCSNSPTAASPTEGPTLLASTVGNSPANSMSSSSPPVKVVIRYEANYSRYEEYLEKLAKRLKNLAQCLKKSLRGRKGAMTVAPKNTLDNTPLNALAVISPQLLDRAKGSHASAYFTLMSIVQGGAFSFLAFVAIGKHAELDFVGWLLGLLTFLVLVLTWNEYVMGVICFRWVPDLLDALIPFVLGAAEVFLIRSVDNHPDVRFLAMSICSFVGFLAFANMYRKANHEPRDNGPTFAALGRFVALSLLYPLVSAVVLLFFWLALKLIGPTPFLSATLLVLAAAMMLGFLVRTVTYWNRFITYARGVPDRS